MKQVYKSEDGQIFDTLEECFINDIQFLKAKSVEFENLCFDYKRKKLPSLFKDYIQVKNMSFKEYRLTHTNMTKTEAKASFKLEYFSKLLNLKDTEKKYRETKNSLKEILNIKRNIEKELNRLRPEPQAEIRQKNIESPVVEDAEFEVIDNN